MTNFDKFSNDIFLKKRNKCVFQMSIVHHNERKSLGCVMSILRFEMKTN